MSVPVFEEIEPAADCGCPGCAQRRRDLARGLPVRAGGHPAAHGARRALVLVTAAGAVLGGGTGAVADAAGDAADAAGAADAAEVATVAAGPVAAGPVADVSQGVDTPQGGPGPLHGAAGPGSAPSPYAAPTSSQISAATLRKSTRTEIINRAKTWVAAAVPYSMDRYWSDGYRQDCSGYISMAWNLPSNEWTGSLDRFADRIARADLQPGDILLFHNPVNPTRGSHATIFGGWTDYTHTSYIAYEQTPPRTRKQATPLAYWENSDKYVAYRYKGVISGGSGSAGSGATTGTPFPGAAKFGPGANNAYVTQLGRLLVARGGQKFYAVGPGPRWGEADRRATQAFQQAQGWKGAEADGIPGPDTWALLVTGKGKSIGGVGGVGGVGGSSGSSGSSASANAFPGRGYFRLGQSNAYVEKLGKQLVKRGYGKYYLSGPGPRWTEADRRNVEAFQRAQGWSGAAADGYPGPETWRRLFL
ncbi:peptidoglycan-binding protein [Streptomyces sp. NPDC048623]|uniref:peptidoglycan-binding protein n=1 Tax=Streptomyces sp. NPDC048623 TaxID=3155761 RepID=UPI003427AD8F